jgi:transcriptional regulator with XRE-family HTH domain
MNTTDLQHLKMVWLAAKETGDTQTQLSLLRDHPEQQAALIDFIAAYHATNGTVAEEGDEVLSQMTQRALQTALERVFVAPVLAANLGELRKQCGYANRQEVAKALRLTVDVWQKFENGTIQLASLSKRQLDRFALFFQVSADQFGTLLTNSQGQASISMLRRQTRVAAKSSQEPEQQSFSEALERSTMSKTDKKYWTE